MSERLHLPLATWRVQYQLLGGHVRVIGGAVMYGICVSIGIVGVRYMLRHMPTNTFSVGALNFVIVGQLLILVIGGCNAVHRSLLRDFESRMIESHRQSPMSNVAVVLGYVFGPSLQVGALGLVNFLVGGVLCQFAALALSTWGAANLLVLTAAVLTWSATVMFGLRAGKPIGPTPVVVVAALMSYVNLSIPGGGLVTGTYAAVFSVWMVNGSRFVPPIATGMILVMGWLVSGLWIHLAAVRYRRPDLPALNASRGLLVLALWVALSVGGIVAFEQVTFSSMRAFHDPNMPRVQWTATLVCTLLLSLLVVKGSTESRWMVEQGIPGRRPSDGRSEWVVIFAAVPVVVILAGAVGYPVLDLVTPVKKGNAESAVISYGMGLAYTGVAFLLTMLLYRALLVIALARESKSLRVAAVVLTAGLLAVPPLIDQGRMALLDVAEGSNAKLSAVFGYSPPGTLIAYWGDLDIFLAPGLVLQTAVVVVLQGVARLEVRRSDRRRPMTAVSGGSETTEA